MKKLAVAAVLALMVIGIVKFVRHHGSAKAQARAACENLAKQCGSLAALGGEKLTASDIDECTTEVSTEGPGELGDQYEPLVGCMASADSCGEAFGCFGGAFANELKINYTASVVASIA